MSLKALKDKFFGIFFLCKSVLFIAIFLLTSLIFIVPSLAASSDTSYFQGKIVIKSDGTNISENNPSCVINGSANDTCDFRVGYYSAATSGDLLWQEDFLNVELGDSNGIFSLALGTGDATGTVHESSYKEVFRNNTDVYTLAKLMGHEGITVLQRYLKQTYQDTEAAHRRAGPVDNCELLTCV